jgi:ribonuclease P protein component
MRQRRTTQVEAEVYQQYLELSTGSPRAISRLTMACKNKCNVGLFHASYRSKSNETHLSAVENPPQPHPWFPGAHENAWWSRRHQCPPSQGPCAPGGVTQPRSRLPRPARLRGGAHFTGAFSERRQGRYFIVVTRNNPGGKAARLGIVIGRRTAPSAVARSAMKRMVREVFRHLRSHLGTTDFVVKVRRPAIGEEIYQARGELQSLLSGGR